MRRINMRWLDGVRAIVLGTRGLSLPDPDRIAIDGATDTAALLHAIDAAMPRTAILELIGPRNELIISFLARSAIATRHSTEAFFVSVADGAVAALARVAADCPGNEICSHLLVHDGTETLLEAFGRDRGENVVWLNPRGPEAVLRLFVDALSQPLQKLGRLRQPVVRLPERMHLLPSP
jgi:hypothetical protein